MNREFRHNTDEQVREYVEKALALVAELEPPDDLRGLVFSNACTFYAAKQIVMEQVAPLAGILGGGGR